MAHPQPHGRLIELDEYEQLPNDERYFDEVSRGRLIREPRPAPRHGRIASLIAHKLMQYVDEHPGCGAVYAESGFILHEKPLTLRGPDVSFVRASRLALEPERGFFAGPPDLAIEVLSPSNTVSAMLEKIGEFLEAGTHVVWLVDPKARSVVIHGPDAPPRVKRGEETLDCPELLPGLAWPVASLFEI